MHRQIVKLFVLSFWIFLFIIPLTSWGDDQKNQVNLHPINSSSNRPSGKIIINICANPGDEKNPLKEYIITFPEMAMSKKEFNPYKDKKMWSNSFEVIRNKEGLVKKLNKEKVKHLLKDYDLSVLNELNYLDRTNDFDLNKKIVLKKKDRLEKQINYVNMFTINDQLSYLKFGNLIINLKTKEVFSPFDGIDAEVFAWDCSGNIIAYENSSLWINNELLICDLNNYKTKLQIKVKENIHGIAWDPTSNYIALITGPYWIGFYPWQILGAMAGHPTDYVKYYLEIYDISGKIIFSKKLSDTIKPNYVGIRWVKSPENPAIDVGSEN